MEHFMQSRQRGLSLISLLVVAAVIGFFGVVFAQAVPTYIEYQNILKAVKKASAESTVQGVRAAFDRAQQIDDFKSISGKDLDVTKKGDNVVVSFAYNSEIHLGGPAYLVLKYQGSSDK
jgi:Tfp pilus assembly protein PilE